MTNVLYIEKRRIDMHPLFKALLLAAAMMAIAVLAVFEIVPDKFAQFAPIALLALFPSVWMGRRCRPAGEA
jgi:hypothetical protein